jgi:hypothetical protein
MLNGNRLACAALTVLAALLTGCAPLKQYRTDLTLCEAADPVASCRDHALQRHFDPDKPDEEYLLGFVELDDQGQLFDREQMRAVVGWLNREAADNDLLLVVFVHGWKHSAAPGDDNILAFRQSLAQLSALESAIYEGSGVTPRKVAGVYLGWRGGSVTAPLVKELSFWNRKKTAHKVGHGGVTEVLSRLDLLRRTKDAIVREDYFSRLAAAGRPVDRSSVPPRSRTRLVVVGHSFGGAVVYSALSQTLMGRFVRTVGPDGQVSNPEGFGDLVVLVNPAFEALRFSPLSDMAAERATYFPSQLPVMAILTSEADDATGIAFPVGRWFATTFENERDVERFNATTGEPEIISQRQANRTAVGHFDPYITHRLDAEEGSGAADSPGFQVRESAKTFANVADAWEQDWPGSEIRFEGAVLTRTETSAGRNPYLVVRVDEELIEDHNDIDDPRIGSFLRQLILISSQSEDVQERERLRSDAMKRLSQPE